MAAVDQTVPLWSVMLTGTTGVLGVLLAGLSAWRDRRHAKDLAERERKQRRLEDAYLELLVMTEQGRALVLAGSAND